MSCSGRQSGVDLDLGDRCSALAFGWAKRTFAARRGRLGEPALEVEGSFSNLMRFGGLRLAMCSDGVGTKVELAERVGRYDTLGHDLVAMVVDDLAANGVEPVNLSNVLDVDHLDPEVVDALMAGLAEAALFAGVAVTGGEIAELGPRIQGFGEGMHFNWCATAIGVLPEGRSPIDGSAVAVGDVVIALRSQGLRSNGFSLARRVLGAAEGPEWHRARCGDGRTWGEALLTPSRIYSPAIQALCEALGGEVHGVVHVTGGGVPGNLARVLAPTEHGASLEDLFAPQPFLVELARLAGVEGARAYRMWNMGQGMLVIVPASSAEGALALLEERGQEARRAGAVVEGGEITLVDKLDGERLRFGGADGRGSHDR